MEFDVSSVCPFSARYFLNPAKGGSLPPPDSQVEQNSRCRRWPLLHRNPPGSIPFAVRFPPFGGTKKMCGPFARSTQKRWQTFASEIPCPVTKSQIFERPAGYEIFHQSVRGRRRGAPCKESFQIRLCCLNVPLQGGPAHFVQMPGHGFETGIGGKERPLFVDEAPI